MDVDDSQDLSLDIQPDEKLEAPVPAPLQPTDPTPLASTSDTDISETDGLSAAAPPPASTTASPPSSSPLGIAAAAAINLASVIPSDAVADGAAVSTAPVASSAFAAQTQQQQQATMAGEPGNTQQQQEPQPELQQPQLQQQQQLQTRRQSRRRVEPTKIADIVYPRQQQQLQPDGVVAAGGCGRAVAGATTRAATAPAELFGGRGVGAGASGPEGRPAKRSRTQQISEDRLGEEVVQSVGLDPWGLAEEEEALLSDVAAQRPGQPPLGRQQYLKVRNLLLTMWRANVRRHLKMEDACKAVQAQHAKYAEVAWTYLHSYGIINFGLAAAVPPEVEHAETVLVIGAGLAGLAAAQQLRQLGYRVLVLEARTRPGGRVHTVRMEASTPAAAAVPAAAAAGGGSAGGGGSGGVVVGLADLGGSIITGCDGNPLAVLALQGGVPLHAIVDETPLYWEDGRPVDAELDRQVFDLYNQVLDRCDNLCQQLRPSAGELISVEAALTAMWRQLAGGPTAAAAVATAMARTKPNAVKARRGSGGGGSGGGGVDERADEKELAGLSDQLFHWHVANLEFANAARASELSLRHWDQDDAYELLGEHTFTAGGNGRLVQLLTQDLPILYGCPVTEIRYGAGGGGGGGSGVTVVTESGAVYEASAAVVTLPLGVLKTEAVRFSPPLPGAKQEAIKRLGYGRLNKVAMLFPYAFWDTAVDTFACAMRDKERRGAYYLFYCGAHTGGAAVLTALVAGSAAIAIESMTDQQVVAEVLRVLRNIFDPQNPQHHHHAVGSGGREGGGGGGVAAEGVRRDSMRNAASTSAAVAVAEEVEEEVGIEAEPPHQQQQQRQRRKKKGGQRQPSAGGGGGGGGGGSGAFSGGGAAAARRPVMVPEPLQALVTRWGSDPYSLGSYSSMAVSCRGAAEYQAMAAPVAGRLFFAGEATIHKYPATMHGAFLSGLREAGRIHYSLARARHGLPPRADGFTGAADGSDEAVAAAATAAGDVDVDVDGGGASPSPSGAPPSGPAMLRVRRLADLAVGLKTLFSMGEADLEFGCFKALFGPQVPGQQQWALVQIDLGYIRSRSAGSGAAGSGAGGGGDDVGGGGDGENAETPEASGRQAAGGAGSAGGGRAGRRRGGTGAAVAGAAGSASVAASARSGGGHRRRAFVHLPLPRAAVEALWCMRGGDDARLLALTGRLGVRLPGCGEAGPDWDPCQQMELLYGQICQHRAPPLPPPALLLDAAIAARSGEVGTAAAAAAAAAGGGDGAEDGGRGG